MSETCPVCHEPIEEADAHRLECGHAFHTACVVKWFRSGNDTCPMCRATPTATISYETVLDRATRMLRRSKARSASAQLRQRARAYRNAKERLLLVTRELREFRALHRDTIKNFNKLRRRIWPARILLRRKREVLGTHGMDQEGLRVVRRWRI